MFDIEAELKKLPKKPGVYIMHDKNDKIIYVGKAVVLRNRVRQYFRKNKKTKRIQNMVALVDHFEYIVCDNEAEALILECNLIKKNMGQVSLGKAEPCACVLHPQVFLFVHEMFCSFLRARCYVAIERRVSGFERLDHPVWIADHPVGIAGYHVALEWVLSWIPLALLG